MNKSTQEIKWSTQNIQIDKDKNPIMKNTLFVVSLLLIGLTIKSISLHVKQQLVIGDSDVFIKDSYNYFVTRSGNKVWAGALSLAWHELTDSIVKENVKLNSGDKLVQKIVDNYNNCPFNKGDLDESSYYIKSGYGQKTVTKINTQVKKKFPKKTFQDIKATLKDQDIISYAYLAITFEYPVKFSTIENFNFKGSPTEGFKSTSEQQRNQVKYYYYINKNQFLVKLKTKKKHQGVYLLRTNQSNASVAETIKKVNSWEKKPLQSLNRVDRFQMPEVDLDYAREVFQVQKIPLLNSKFTNYAFSTVYEGVKVKIDEAGVKVENEGVIVLQLTSAFIDKPPEPKEFIFDDNFWVILKQQGKHPYMVINVNDPKETQQL